MTAWIIAAVLAGTYLAVGTYYSAKAMDWINGRPYTTLVFYLYPLVAFVSMVVWGTGLGIFVLISPLKAQSLLPFMLFMALFSPFIILAPVHYVLFEHKKLR